MRIIGSATISFAVTLAVGWLLLAMLSTPPVEATLEITEHPDPLACDPSPGTNDDDVDPCPKPWSDGLGDRSVHRVEIEGAGQWWECNWFWSPSLSETMTEADKNRLARSTQRDRNWWGDRLVITGVGDNVWKWECRQYGRVGVPPQAPAPTPLQTARPPCPPSEMGSSGHCPTCDEWLNAPDSGGTTGNPGAFPTPTPGSAPVVQPAATPLSPAGVAAARAAEQARAAQAAAAQAAILAATRAAAARQALQAAPPPVPNNTGWWSIQSAAAPAPTRPEADTPRLRSASAAGWTLYR